MPPCTADSATSCRFQWECYSEFWNHSACKAFVLTFPIWKHIGLCILYWWQIKIAWRMVHTGTGLILHIDHLVEAAKQACVGMETIGSYFSTNLFLFVFPPIVYCILRSQSYDNCMVITEIWMYCIFLCFKYHPMCMSKNTFLRQRLVM